MKPEAEGGGLNRGGSFGPPSAFSGALVILRSSKVQQTNQVLMTESTQKRVALVEDSPDNAEVFTMFLGQLCDDLQVCPFSTGAAFLETFQEGIYQVVILDISLPEMDGCEVLRRMRLID